MTCVLILPPDLQIWRCPVRNPSQAECAYAEGTDFDFCLYFELGRCGHPQRTRFLLRNCLRAIEAFEKEREDAKE